MFRDQGLREFGVEYGETEGGVDLLRGTLHVHIGEDSLLTVDKAIQVTFCTLRGLSHLLFSAVHISPQAKRGPGCGEPVENTIKLTV